MYGVSVHNKQRKVGQIINVPDWDDALPEIKKYTNQQLAQLARTYAKRSNQRLVKLEQQGFTRQYGYEQAMTNLAGQFESPEAAERGHASYANVKGTRFIENQKKLEALDRGTLLTMLQQMTYHLRRQTTSISDIKRLTDKKYQGFLGAMATIEHTSKRKIREKYKESEILEIMNSEAFRILRNIFGYRTATQTVRDDLGKDNYKKLESDLKKERARIEEANRGKPKSEWGHLESTDAYDRFIRAYVTGG